jgi:hypothetical protein
LPWNWQWFFRQLYRPTSGSIANESKLAKADQRHTRTSTSRRTLQRLFFWVASRCALAKKLQWDGPGMEGNQCSRRGLVRETRVSPILMAYPEAYIYAFSPKGIQRVAYEDTEHYRITRDFLSNPKRMLKVLLAPESPIAEPIT